LGSWFTIFSIIRIRKGGYYERARRNSKGKSIRDA
jgi:hypothetical protein